VYLSCANDAGRRRATYAAACWWLKTPAEPFEGRSGRLLLGLKAQTPDARRCETGAQGQLWVMLPNGEVDAMRRRTLTRGIGSAVRVKWWSAWSQTTEPVLNREATRSRAPPKTPAE